MAEKTTHELSIPAGPVAEKYKDFVYNEEFKEMAFLGPFNTAKSSALVDWLIISGLEYPGANLVLTRAALSDLRRTTMTKYLSRAGKVLVEDFNKREAVIEFPEIQGKKSTLYMFGLDRHDLTEVLKSFEPFRAAVEESNEVPTYALDLLLGRVRQKVSHRRKTNRWLVGKMASLWGVSFEAAQGYLGFDEAALDEKMQGKNQLKHVFNPGGNEPMWKRVVGVPYPLKEEMGPEWTRQNVNVREFKHPPETLKSFTWDAGQIAEWGEPPQREFVGKDHGDELELVTGVRIPKRDAYFVGKRAAIFAWPHENWSRNVQADENFLYMDDPEIREQFYEAKFDTKKGLVLPAFDRGIHVVPDPERDVPRGLRGIVSVDHGFSHPTVALFGVLVHRPPGGFLVLKEYMVQGRSAMDNAYQIAGLPPAHMEDVTFWADPSMWRTEATSMRSVADEYAEAGVPLLRADNNVEYTVNAAQELLRPVTDLRSGEDMPKLFVCASCKNLIHAMETTTHSHMSSSRDNWIVDMVDALRYLASGIYNQSAIKPHDGPPPHHVRVWDWS